MKIAVYTIVKNAEPYINDWIDSASDADVLVLGDTGSTDHTVRVARKRGVKVYNVTPEEPFHFGNARNLALDRIPADIDVCVSLDADEVLLPGWREAIEQEWTGECTVMMCMMISAYDTWVARIHKRNAHWGGRIHENIIVLNSDVQSQSSVQIKHNQDRNRSRNFYIDLLELQANEDSNPRNLKLLGVELLHRGQVAKGIETLTKYLEQDVTNDVVGQANACNMLYYATQDIDWLYRSIRYCPEQQEAYQRIAAYMAHNDDWLGTYHFASIGKYREPLHLSAEYLLSDEALDVLLAEAAFQIGKQDEAVDIAVNLVKEYGPSYEEHLARYESMVQ